MGSKVVVMSACLLLASMASASETSKSLAFATYKETTDRVEVVVGSLIAGVAEHEKYMPLQFAVAVDGKGPELEVTPDRFQLIDSKGNIYNAASAHEVAKEPSVHEYARDYNKQNPLATGFEFTMGEQRVMSNFYPQEGGKFYVVSHLSRDTYLEDVLFFPNPGDALEGVLTLQFLTPGMDQAVAVRFEVPLKGKKTKKQKQDVDN